MRDHSSVPDSAESDALLWSMPLAGGTGLLITDRTGGCVVTLPRSIVAYDPSGDLRWDVPRIGTSSGGEPVITPDQRYVHIEGDRIVIRDLHRGDTVASFPVQYASGLCAAPWGDLLYSQADPGGIAAVRCVASTGEHRWSVSLDDSAPLAFEPFVLGDLVVVERRGALWAFDRDGDARWVADLSGMHPPSADDDDPRPSEGLRAALRLEDAPVRFAADRVVVELAWYTGRGLYRLDGGAHELTPVAVPSPALPPFAALPGAPTEYRIAGTGPNVEVARFEWEYPVVAIEPAGGIAWEHRLPAPALSLVSTPGGNLIAAASPSFKRWTDHHEWYDLSAEMFVRSLAPDGTARWTWYAPGPLTHLPVASTTGIVYVGCGNRLWAFAADALSA